LWDFSGQFLVVGLSSLCELCTRIMHVQRAPANLFDVMGMVKSDQVVASFPLSKAYEARSFMSVTMLENCFRMDSGL